MLNRISAELRKYEFRAVAPQPLPPQFAPQTVVNHTIVQRFYPQTQPIVEQRQQHPVSQAPPELKQGIAAGNTNRQAVLPAKRQEQAVFTAKTPFAVSKTLTEDAPRERYNHKPVPLVTIVPKTATFIPSPSRPQNDEESPVLLMRETKKDVDQEAGIIRVESQLKYSRAYPIFKVNSLKRSKTPRVPIFLSKSKSATRKPLFSVADSNTEACKSRLRYSIFDRSKHQKATVTISGASQLTPTMRRDNPIFATKSKQVEVVEKPFEFHSVKHERLHTPPRLQQLPVAKHVRSTKPAEPPPKTWTPPPSYLPPVNYETTKPRSPVEPINLRPAYSPMQQPVGPAVLVPVSPVRVPAAPKPPSKEGRPIRPMPKLDPTMTIVAALTITAAIWLMLALWELLVV